MPAARVRAAACLAVALAVVPARAEDKPTREAKVPGPDGITVVARMRAPEDAEVPLQVVCYLRHKASGDTLVGAPVVLDQRLGGVIASLRNRGEFAGDELETLVLETGGRLKAKRLLLIGVGTADGITEERYEKIGRTAYREAAKLGATTVAFASMTHVQGIDHLKTRDVARHVVRGVLLARDTDLRLQKEGLAKPFVMTEWAEEAGPAYFDVTVEGLTRAVEEAKAVAAARTKAPFAAPAK